MSRIQHTLAQLKQRREGALIPYLTVGYPTIEDSRLLIQAFCEAGADLVELGVPFSDPLADGPTIQETSQVALRNGVTVERCLDVAATLRKAGIKTPFILMGYCNPFLAFGIDQLARAAAAAGIDGLIIPDLPLEEARPWWAACCKNGLDLIFFLAPTTPQRRLEAVVKWGSGFIYCLSVTGVTGARLDLPTGLPAFIGRVRKTTDLPLAVGFGISTPEQVREVVAVADAAIVGSALINIIKHHPREQQIQAASDFVRDLKAATHRRDASRQVPSPPRVRPTASATDPSEPSPANTRAGNTIPSKTTA